jgi:endonuclease/exonuclease/phosphatase family metal-dependent hydrolase
MSLRVGTFNVWGLPEAFSDDVSSRMRGLAARLPGLPLDLLLVQEAWTDEVRDTLREAALRAGFEVAGGRTTSGGLMVLSRKAIRTSRFETYHFRGDPERLAQGEFLGGKGFQTLEVDASDGPLTVINTHLHARYRRHRPRLNSAVRTAQLLQLIGAMHRIDGMLLVGGDFNCTADDVEYRVFSGLSRAVELGGGRAFATLSRANYYKQHRSDPDKRVDYLFVRPGSRTRWKRLEAAGLFHEPEPIRGRDRSLSDHFGFQARIAWHPAAAAPGAARGAGELDPKAFDLARRLLEVGREEADRRERVHFRSAGGWALAAAVAAGVRRHPALDRRRFLRTTASTLAVVALTPAIGYGTLARIDSDIKRDAFDDAHDVLAKLEAGPHRTA